MCGIAQPTNNVPPCWPSSQLQLQLRLKIDNQRESSRESKGLLENSTAIFDSPFTAICKIQVKSFFYTVHTVWNSSILLLLGSVGSRACNVKFAFHKMLYTSFVFVFRCSQETFMEGISSFVCMRLLWKLNLGILQNLIISPGFYAWCFPVNGANPKCFERQSSGKIVCVHWMAFLAVQRET